MKNNMKKEFYKEKWFMWISIILFAPLGIFLMYEYDGKFSNKAKIIISICAIIFSIGVLNSGNQNDVEKSQISAKEHSIPSPIKIKTCDGINVTKDCVYEGVMYSKYIYYPAKEEKSHIEKTTTYTQEISGYCTKCNDGTYSPSCAVGRGACSHHGGVAQYNAPIYKSVAHTNETKIIDEPVTEERYEKIIKGNVIN